MLPSQHRRVAARLQQIVSEPPPHVPRLLSYGLADHVLRLEFERIEGLSLHALNSHLEQSDTRLKARLRYCFAQVLNDWNRNGFVHGDLSPRNILLDTRTGMGVWCIDWIVDLQSYECTPRYASLEVLKGLRSTQSDRHAFDTILKSWGHG